MMARAVVHIIDGMVARVDCPPGVEVETRNYVSIDFQTLARPASIDGRPELMRDDAGRWFARAIWNPRH